MITLDSKQIKALLPHRARDTHKHACGHVLIIGGDQGMSGAALLAGHAALRSGAGLVSVATHPAHAAFLNINRPELMCHAIETATELDTLIKHADVLVIGPGLGNSPWALMLLKAAWHSDKPIIIDAGALDYLKAHPRNNHNHILTPHPGEAARLLNTDTKKIQHDRPAAVQQLQQQFGGIAILKGADTLIADGQDNHRCPFGNPGMASAGSGDVLSGILGALAAQGLTLSQAAQLGVGLHALAGDAAAQTVGTLSLIASDIIEQLPAILR